MKDIAIYGAGGLGREIACQISKLNEIIKAGWNLIGFFDDGKAIGEDISHFGKCLGGLAQLNDWETPLNVVLCFGSPRSLAKIHSLIVNPNINFPNIVSPDFSINDPETFKIGKGNIITGQCSATTNVAIGNFNLLNGHVHLGHDIKIGNFNVFMPGSRISGEVSIGCQNLIGADSFVKQQIKVGNNVTLSPLSALLTKPKDGNTYIGNPAKIFKF